jgi:hypothetical protein
MKNYVAIVVFSKETPNDVTLRRIMAGEYFKLYNEAVDLINPWYEVWNAQYDELYSDKNTGDNPEDYAHYCKFIAEKHQTVFDKVNIKGRIVELYSGEEASIAARSRKNHDWTMNFVLKEK